MNKDIIKELANFGDVDVDVSFTNLTTFRTGGKAAIVVYPRNAFSLATIIEICTKEKVPYKVFGNGSNILASDDDFEGVIIKLTRYFNQYYFNDDVLCAEGGCSIITLAYKALGNNLTGLEFASGIPATLAGAIYMNAGAYKSEMKNIVESVSVLINGEIVTLQNEDCGFAYRHSIFQEHPDWIIVESKLKLRNGEHSEIEKLMNSRRERRMQTQPLDMPSAGSTFRNPTDGFAWQYIDEIGYRGKFYGGAQVSTKHSNFIVNANRATSSDINNLANEIIEKVKEVYDVELMMEVEKFNWKQ